MKLNQKQLKTLIPYAPEGHPSPTQYVNMVNTMIMGADKKGRTRPIEDLYYFLQVSKRAGLDPTLKQIYAVYRWNSRLRKEAMSIQTGIDGMRNVAERTGKYGGSKDAEFEYGGSDKAKPALARVTVYKLVGDKVFEVTASARWEEYYPGDKLGAMWQKMPHVMLAKVAEALALRKAFPITSGLYVAEEMDQAEETLPTPKAIEEKKAKAKEEKETEAKKPEKKIKAKPAQNSEELLKKISKKRSEK